jgi:hypothetical protein
MLSADTVSLILCGTSDIPRRVAVRDGRIEHATTRDEEVHCLSRLGEIVKSARGDVVYSRDHIELMDVCIRSNDPAAWKAMCDDIVHGCVPDRSIGEYFDARHESAAGLVRSLINATCIEHAISIVQSMTVAFRESGHGTHAAISEGMHAPNGILVVRLFATHARTMPHAIKNDALRALGKLIPTTNVARGIVLDLLAKAASSKWDGVDNDVVHVLGHCPHISLLETDAKISFGKALLESIPKMPTARRGPALHTLSRVVECVGNVDACIALAVDALQSTKNSNRAEESTIRGAARVLRAASVAGGGVHVLADRLLYVLDDLPCRK